MDFESQFASEAQPLEHGASDRAWDRFVDANDAEPPALRETIALLGDEGL